MGMRDAACRISTVKSFFSIYVQEKEKAVPRQA
jgi:hypothetical protein